MPENVCWICGKEANSGEHFIKVSDLRSVFGYNTAKCALYKNVNGKTGKQIVSIRSDRLTYRIKLCAKCNNSITQRYDMAWEKFSLYLRERRPQVKGNSAIRLELVFPGTEKQSMLYVYLYFLKQFGCVVREHDIPVDMSGFSSCIRDVKAHPNVWLSIWGDVGNSNVRRVAISPVRTVMVGENAVFATWLHVVDSIAVNVIYVTPSMGSQLPESVWHPDFLRRKITILGRDSWGR